MSFEIQIRSDLKSKFRKNNYYSYLKFKSFIKDTKRVLLYLFQKQSKSSYGYLANC